MTNIPFPYPGGKFRLAKWIISHMPPTDRYVEPFFGSGAVYFSRPQVRNEAINDLDGDVANFFRVLRDESEELIRLCSLTPYSREEFLKCREKTDEPIERARRFWVRVTQSYQAEGAGWRAAFVGSSGGRHRVFPILDKIEYMPEFAKRLRTAIIDCRDVLDVMKSHNKEDVLIYCDPPYHKETRADGLYGVDDFDHDSFLECVVKHKARIIISGYSHPDYETALEGWGRVECDVLRRMGRHERRVEVLWMNYSMENSLSLF